MDSIGTSILQHDSPDGVVVNQATTSRGADPAAIDALGVNGLEHGRCETVQNSGSTHAIPFVCECATSFS